MSTRRWVSLERSAACRALAVVLLVTVAAATLQCGGDGSPIGPSPQAVWRPEAAWAHLDELLGVMRQYSANAGRIDWDALRAAVTMGAGVNSAPDIPAALSVALRLLDDHESYYVGRNGAMIGPSPIGACRAATGVVDIPDTVGYVRVGGCPCQGAAEITKFAESIQDAIRTADRAGLTGWIVDFRGNGGGNMWPMIAGVGPILGRGNIGWIVYNNREYEREYVDGGAQSFGEVFAQVASPYTLRNPFPKVAVLTDGSVVSAGEAVVVYFRNRPLTRSFGMATCGHHHLMEPIALGDGSTLVLVTARHADRLKVPYSGPVQPDEIVADPTDAVERAVAWLQARD